MSIEKIFNNINEQEAFVREKSLESRGFKCTFSSDSAGRTWKYYGLNESRLLTLIKIVFYSILSPFSGEAKELRNESIAVLRDKTKAYALIYPLVKQSLQEKEITMAKPDYFSDRNYLMQILNSEVALKSVLGCDDADTFHFLIKNMTKEDIDLYLLKHWDKTKTLKLIGLDNPSLAEKIMVSFWNCEKPVLQELVTSVYKKYPDLAIWEQIKSGAFDNRSSYSYSMKDLVYQMEIDAILKSHADEELINTEIKKLLKIAFDECKECSPDEKRSKLRIGCIGSKILENNGSIVIDDTAMMAKRLARAFVEYAHEIDDPELIASQLFYNHFSEETVKYLAQNPLLHPSFKENCKKGLLPNLRITYEYYGGK